MASDNLLVVLAEIRDDLGEMPEAAWQQLRRELMRRAGGQSLYVPRQSKRNKLEIIAAAGADVSARHLAKMLGISPRRVRQLRQLL